jgi:pimeloyl-ACP methyl ester carboxylesterase
VATYVLVPGFWLGAWVWRDVAEDLRAHGHTVYPVSLTGLGDRVHLARPDTDLNVHVQDLTNLLHYEDLREVILVGHSYAGSVVTMAADRATDRVARLVYVDTGPLPDGVTQNDFNPPEERERTAAFVAEAGDGWLIPPPAWAELAAEVSDVDADMLARLTARSVPQPWATATTPVRLTGAWEKLPRLAILSSFTSAQMLHMAQSMPVLVHMTGEAWRFVELPTWHWPMVNRVGELAEILRAEARLRQP